MSHWNYRVLVTKTGFEDELDFAIHEVYYDDNEKPEGYTENAIGVSADTMDGIDWVLSKMKEARHKSVLWGDERFPEEYNENKL